MLGAGDVDEIVGRIQVFVAPRRIRVREFFNDSDPLRCGRCTLNQMHRAINRAGLDVSEEEVELIAETFTETGPKVQKPQIFNYTEFCKAIDQVFADPAGATMAMSMSRMSSPGSTMACSFMAQTFEDEESEEYFQHVLHRLATLCKTRGVMIKACYTDLDRAPIASPSRQNPRRGGKVTKMQFIRGFPFKKEMTEQDVEILCQRYNVSAKYHDKEGDIHFVALHNDISDVMNYAAPPFPTSPLHLKPDDTEWSHGQLSVLQKLRSRVVEKRVRLREQFKDFDALRKGICTTGQMKTVLTIMDLSKYIGRTDFEMLVAMYTREDGMFNYEAFCADVNQAFATPGLEKAPMMQTFMPDVTTTAPARRNQNVLSAAKMDLISAIEDKVRTIVRKKGMLIKPIFTDFDKPHCGYVTRSQASRVLATLGFGLSEQEVGMLCGYYCDQGNHTDFNYQEFIRRVDPNPEGVVLAMSQSMQPHLGYKTMPYFNEHGKVKPGMTKSMSSPMMLA
mmetsp:Transcript_22718/g.57943  ORF Transcript_22718/g.57943 Transcript_22718/m.57943 type:complete len:506 (+) Transcript_22718:93-1610(+)